MRKYLDKVIKADQCAQYLDSIGISANIAEQLAHQQPQSQLSVHSESWSKTYNA